jgi:hypothetical protein
MKVEIPSSGGVFLLFSLNPKNFSFLYISRRFGIGKRMRALLVNSSKYFIDMSVP